MAQQPHRRPPAPLHQQGAPRKRRRNKKLLRRVILLVAILAVLLGAAWLIVSLVQRQAPAPSGPAGGAAQNWQNASLPSFADDPPQDGPASGWMPEVDGSLWNHTTPLLSRLEIGEPIRPDYRMFALPENGRVDLSYFDTAVFVGDSLAQGFSATGYPEQGGTGVLAGTGARFCTYHGISMTQMINGSLHTNQDGVQEVPLDTLAAMQPETVYISMTINAMLHFPDNAVFLEAYGVMLDTLRQRLGPEVDFYILSATPVSSWTTEFDTERIRALNNYLAKLVWEKGMYFIDSQEPLAAEDGFMLPDFPLEDGYHMNRAGYEAWLDYLVTHTAYNPRHAGKYLPEAPAQEWTD